MSAPRIEDAWVNAPETRAVMSALGGEAYFVGGCVRNALMGLAASDVDLATALLPETVRARIETAGLRAVPTGIEHGTVTAVAGGRAFEITTYRADIDTDGRRAVVRFTDDMVEDARRRDFTMNALYADAGGRVIDPLGGLADLAEGRVRFIGRAEDRIREDYLRILRFFRFSAWYGRGPLDDPGLAACTALADGIRSLARERIGAEMRKLLAAPDPRPAVTAMAQTAILALCLPGADHGVLAPVLAAEAAAGAAPNWHLRLAALAPSDPVAALRLSRAEARRFETIQSLARRPDPPVVLAERGGVEAARAAVLLRAGRQDGAPPADMELALTSGAGAVFPLQAGDLLAAGVPRGPALGEALAEAREAWRRSDLTLDRDALCELAVAHTRA